MKIDQCENMGSTHYIIQDGGSFNDIWIHKRPTPSCEHAPLKKKRRTRAVASFASLPIDIISSNIWSFCTAGQIFKLRSICSTWKELVEQSTLALHFSSDRVLGTEQVAVLITSLANGSFRAVERLDFTHQPQIKETHAIQLLRSFRSLKYLHLTQTKALSKCLREACRLGMLQIVPHLIEQGACLLPSKNHYSPLYTAARYKHTSIMKLLLRLGADVRVSDDRYLSMLQVAATHGDLERMSVLLEAGAFIDWITVDGSALSFAIRHGQRKAAEFLLSKGADIELWNYEGMTPLLVAASCGDLEALELLVRAGANIKQCDKNGLSAIAHAAKNNHEHIVEYFVRLKSTGSTKQRCLPVASIRQQ